VHSNGDDGALREWNPLDGRQRFEYPDLGNGPISSNVAGLIAVSNPDQQVVTVLDPRMRGEVDTLTTCDGPAIADTLTVVNGVAALHARCGDEVAATSYVVDLTRGETTITVPGRELGALAMSPDGGRVVDQRLDDSGPGRDVRRGAMEVRDALTGEPLVTLEAVPDEPDPPEAQRLRWSPDGTMIAAAMDTELAVWDAMSGSLLHRTTTDDENVGVVDVAFTPDSTQLIATTTDWRITARSLETWEVVAEREQFVDGGYRLGLIGHTADGSSLLAVGGFQANSSSSLVWLDPQTFEQQRARPNVHEGTITAAALNADTTLVATASSDGSVRVWDIETGELADDLPGSGTPLYGIDFVGDRHLVVAPGGGGLLTLTIDDEELLTIAQSTLTKGFTLADCERFNFDASCPTLAELGARSTAPGEQPEGEFAISWTRDELVDAATAWMIDQTGVVPGPEFDVLIDGLATDLAGRYTVTLAAGRFDILNDRHDEPYCIGTYEVRDDRIWMRSERGGDCYPIKLFDATFDVSDDALRFDPTDFRGSGPNLMIFAARPLERVR
jgi:WD40 repeat protein